MQHLTDADYQSAIKTAHILVLKYYADWCGPCQMMRPVFEEVAGKIAETNAGVEFAEMNIDESPGGTDEAGVMTIPTIIVYKDGEEVDRLIGGGDAAGVMEFIKSNLEG